MNDPYKFVKENGIFYTDEKLAKTMISYLNIDYKKIFSLIEPAVGEGHILSIIVKKYFYFNKDKKEEEIINFLENNIVGFDIREEAINKCIEKLDTVAIKYLNKRINWNIKKFDAIDRKNMIKQFGTFDYVISNPPYVSRHNMDERTIEALKENSIFCSKYNFDLYYYFFEIGLDLWNKKGKMVYITPNSYIKARSGEIMMKYLIDNSLIETIIDYKDKMLFEDANTYTAITCLSIQNKVLRVRDSKGHIILKVPYNDLKGKLQYKIYSHDFLIQSQDNYIELGEFAEVRNGLATLQDKIFIINEKEILNETDELLIIKKNNEIFELELEGLKKVIRVSSIQDKKYVIFPYIQSNNSKTLYTQHVDIKNQYIGIDKYLSSQLSKEYQKKYGIYFGRTQGFTCYFGYKIVIPKVASLKNRAFKIVNQGFIQSGLSIKLKEEYLKTDLNQILDYLNSDVVYDYLSITSKNYAAGYKSISSTDLKRIKVPKSLLKVKK